MRACFTFTKVHARVTQSHTNKCNLLSVPAATGWLAGWLLAVLQVLIEATEKLLSRIAHHVYHDHDISTFAIQEIDQTMDDKGYTISWTNESLPHHPCPRAAIHQLYEKLGDLKRQSDGVSIPPSKALSKVLAPEFRVRGVGLRLQTNCAGAPEPQPGSGQAPVVRNPIELLQIRQGTLTPRVAQFSSRERSLTRLSMTKSLLRRALFELNGIFSNRTHRRSVSIQSA